MAMNIDTLTDKIYQEGIEKAEAEAAEIIDNAKKEALKIRDQAKARSEEIIHEANEKSAELMQNTLTDIRLAGNKSILALKQEIKRMIKTEILDKNISKAFSDPDFLKEILLEVIKQQAGKIDTVVLSQKMKEKLSPSFLNSLGKSLKNIKVDFNKRIEGGFQIMEDKSGYMVTFTDKDFVAFFSPFLNETTEKALFKVENE